MYSIAMCFYAGMMGLIALFHSKVKKMLEGQKNTFSLLKSVDRDSEYIWVHAASLGEFEQGRPLMERIRERYPEYKILLTFFSPSGYEVRKNYPGADVICYLPFDTKGRVRRFLNSVNLKTAIFIKYEFWLNYLTELHVRKIPTYIVSARFRPEQVFFRSYGGMFRKVLPYFDKLFVQDQASKDLLNTIHVSDNVIVSGDTRFDRVLTVKSQAKELPIIEKFASDTDFVFIAGSSWPKDESIFVPYFDRSPNMKLIIAPHEIHEEHIVSIERSLKRPSLRYSLADESNVKDADCLIIDSFGILSSLYRYGDMAYIGGGFGVGIHNILEAAVYGIPVIFGPNYKKFKEASDIIAMGGGFSVKDQSEFDNRMNSLLNDPEYLKSAGKKAGNYVSDNSGATEIILKNMNIG